MMAGVIWALVLLVMFAGLSVMVAFGASCVLLLSVGLIALGQQ